MKIADLIRNWSRRGLALIGVQKPPTPLELARQNEDAASIGARVAATVGTAGWGDILNAQDELDKLLLEKFVDGSLKDGIEMQRHAAFMQGYRLKMAVAYDLIKAGLEAERRRKSEKNTVS